MNTDKKILKQYLWILCFWIPVLLGLIIIFAFYGTEMSNINYISFSITSLDNTSRSFNQWIDYCSDENLSQAAKNVVYNEMFHQLWMGSPLIWFANLVNQIGISSVDPSSNWGPILTNITASYVYLFMCLLIAIIVLLLYIFIIIQLLIREKKSIKFNLTNKYPSYLNNFSLYKTKMYVDFLVVISIFFSFFNLAATSIIIIYIVIVFYFNNFLNKFLEKNNKQKVSNLAFNKSDLKNYYVLLVTMLILYGYAFAKALFIKWFNVDIGIVLSAFFSVGTLALVIGMFIRNFMASSIGKINKGIKSIEKQINEFKVYYYSSGAKCLNDFEFIKKLPPFINKDLISKKISKENVLERLEILDKTTKLYEETITKLSQKKFMLYRLYNEITTIDEIIDISTNLIKMSKTKKNK